MLELSEALPRCTSTPMFLEFAAGDARLRLLAVEHGHLHAARLEEAPATSSARSTSEDWDEFWNDTDWDYWESRQDDLCQNCAMHSGFEASAVRGLRKSPEDMLRMAAWNFLG